MYKIFISAMAYDNGQSGISDYINNVVKELSKKHKLDILILQKDKVIFPVKNDNINFITYSNSLARPIFSMLWHLFALPILQNYQKYNFIFLPAGNRRIMAFYPSFTITTFHDLSQFHIAQKYDRFRMFYIQRIIPFFLKNSHEILTVSEATKNDVIKFYGIKEKKISVAYNGYDASKYNLKKPVKSIGEILPKTKLYILYVARVEHPGKNHLNLVKAYEMLPAELKEKYDLICAGGLKERSDEVLSYVEKSTDKDNINFTGFFPAEDLAELYKNASLFVMPSFYEGFGIPLVEAMACGVAVTCSDRGPLPEVVGEAALLFNPDKPEDICNKIVDILTDADRKIELIEKGMKRVQEFSWQKHADAILQLYAKKNE